MKVLVNKIIPFSSVDGPGNRTAIFLQGCNINCKYCHNPETRGICVGCGICVDTCPTGALQLNEACDTKDFRRILFEPSKCISCDTCIHVCTHDSSPKTRDMDAREVYAEVKKQIPFIRGITVSGGECMLQPQFLTELFTLAKQDGLGTLIDSNGTIPFEGMDELLEVTDGVMLDIKAFSDEDHRRVTDYGNKEVLANASFLARMGKLYEVRAVVVPDLYDTTKSIKLMGEFLAPFLKIKQFRVKLIAYRPIGVRPQYASFQIPDQEYLKKLADLLQELGFSEIICI